MGKRSGARKEYGELRDTYGLLPSEAHRIQMVPNWRSLPWVGEILQERKTKWDSARRRGVNRNRWENDIVQSYVEKKWLRPGLAGPSIDPYAMVRARVDKYHRDHPEYQSPWQTKTRNLAREARAIKNASKQADFEWKMRLEGAY
jgi:hypothetical protein